VTLSATTPALVVREAGGPEVMRLEDWPIAPPGPGQVRVRQRAIGVNFIDVYQRSGLYPQKLPVVVGNEGAGEIVAVGEGVTGLAEGDRVGYASVIGAYAQERLLPADRAFRLPDGIDFDIAAAVMLKGTTAWYLLFRTFMVGPGDTILWHAAAGGVGQLACQWAKALGARVIGTAGSAEKLAIALASGCEAAINYSDGPFAPRVRELTGGAGVDVVYDGVGQATFEASLDCLKPRGLMVSFGNASGVVSIPDLGILARKGALYVTRPTTAPYLADPEEYRTAMTDLFAAIGAGLVKVGITGRYALADAGQAHAGLAARRTTGSVILAA
jgi:NADPH2:quinone reductase